MLRGMDQISATLLAVVGLMFVLGFALPGDGGDRSR